MSEYKESYSCPHGKIFERIDLSEAQAIETLKDFMKNPDDYFSKKYPHIPLKFYDSVKYAIEKLEQPTLNENQQIVLEWLKEYMLDDSDFYNTIYALKYLRSYGVPYREESKAFTKLNNRELAQVLEVFSKWASEQEEE